MPLQLANFSAWVTVDGIELPQYAVEYSPDGERATCWIASEAGKNFTVCWTDSERSYTSSGRLTIDGLKCGGGRHIYATNDPLDRGRNKARRNSFTTSATTKRPFLFSNIELTDDDAYLHIPMSSELGDIRLDVKEVKIKSKVQNITGANLAEPGRIHECSKKLMEHRFRLGDEVAGTPHLHSKTITCRHIATFVFKYRPLARLQADGFIPLKKEPKVDTTPHDIIDLTRHDGNSNNDLSSLTSKQGRRSKRLTTEIKSEVKVEHSTGDYGSGDIIDLT